MWKLFEKALGRNETEEPVQDSGRQDSARRKQDSGLQIPDAWAEARNAGSGNDGAMSALRDEVRDEKRDERPGAEEAARNAPETSPDEPQPAPGLDPTANVAPAANVGSAAITATDLADLESKIKAAMRTVYDPEIPINIYELGLIYGLEVEPEGKVHVRMTLTAPSCPEAQTLPARVQQVIQEVPGVSEAAVELVWEPTWSPKQMSEAARLQLGIF